MPRKGYQTVTMTDAIAELLDSLPGKSRMEKIERLIKERTQALKNVDLTPTIVIAKIRQQLPSWSESVVWELLDVVLEHIKSSKYADDLTGSALLKKMVNGNRPTDAEIIEVCQVEDLSEEKMFRIRECLFPTEQKNGNNI